MSKSLIRRAGLGLAATVAAGALAFGAALPANADPAPAGSIRAIPGVGSDTIQDVLNGVSQKVLISGAKVVGSYDATGSATITSNTANGSFLRPNGSTDGVKALSAAIQGTSAVLSVGTTRTLNTNDVKFARSSSNPTVNTTGPLQYIPFAVDAVSYATSGLNSFLPTNLPLGSTLTDGTGTSTAPALLTLRNIYRGGQFLSDGTTGAQVYYAGTAYADQAALDAAFPPADTVIKVYPYLPQAGSGTRSFWAGQVGINATTPPAHVTATYLDSNGAPQPVQEHNGSAVSLPSTSVPNGNPLADSAIVPFSISQHIAQGRATALSTAYGVTVNDRRFSATLNNINGITPLASGALNSAFPVSRTVYNVVEKAAITTGNAKFNANLAAVFSGSSALAYTQPTALSVPGSTNLITDFGFGISSNAGAVLDSFRSNFVS